MTMVSWTEKVFSGLLFMKSSLLLRELLFVIAFILLSVFLFFPSATTLLWMAVFVVMVGEITLFGFNMVNPIFLITVAYSVIYILPISLGEFQGSSGLDILVFKGLASLHLGASIAYGLMVGWKGRVRKKEWALHVKIKFTPIALFGMLMVGIISVSFFFHPELLTDSRGANQFEQSTLDKLGKSAALFLPAISIIIVYSYCILKRTTRYFLTYNSSYENVILIFLMLSPLLYDAVTAGRSHSVFAILGWLVVYSVYVKRIPIFKSLFVSLAVVFFSALMLLMRNSMVGGVEGIELAFNAMGSSSVLDLAIVATKIGHQLQILQEIMNYTIANDYQYGISYLKTFLNIIPFTHFMYDDFFPLSLFYKENLADNQVLGFDFSGLAEMYLQGGLWGIMISQCALGMTLALVYYKLYYNRGFYSMLFYSGFLFGSIWWYRSDLLNLMRYIENMFVVFIIYLIVALFLRVLSFKQRHSMLLKEP